MSRLSSCGQVRNRREARRWRNLGDGCTFGGLIGIGLIGRISKPEIAIMPEYDTEGEQKQAERSDHEFALAAIMMCRRSGLARSRHTAAIRSRNDGV